MERLDIYLFGGFLLERGGVALPPIASRAGRSLFAHLVANRDRPLQRDLLAGTFWPDLPEGRARRRLSHTLWQIQDVVNTDDVSYLDVSTDTLSFDASTPYWLDVQEFDRLFVPPSTDRSNRLRTESIEASRLRECVELYRGDFLAGYFDDWVIRDQDFYRQRYLTALRRLIDATKASGAYEEALSFARQLTHHDPLSEESHQEVMRLCFLLGRTSDAIEQFERCRSVLEEELDATPSAPTVEIYEKIVRHRRAGIRPLGEEEKSVLRGRRSDAPFVGREDERRVLVDSLERVLAGSGGVVLVEGEPGVGKTRLTLETAEDARWRGFEVSWGSCRPGAIRPFAPLIEVLESLSPLRAEQLSEQVESVWLGEAAKLAPALASRLDDAPSPVLRPAEESTRMIEGLVHTLEALGSIAPHVVVIDDVHWADEDTLAVLTQLGPRLADSRVLLVLLYRSEEARGDATVWDVMRDMDRVAGLGRVVLSPMSVFEIEEMVRRILGVARLESGVAARLHRQTGGNALFTLETLLALRDRGLFESGANPAVVLESQTTGPVMPVAPRARSVIESRLALLAAKVSSVYEMAAILADTFDVELMESITGLPRSIILDAVDELLYRGLITDDGSGHYRIAHDQVGQVVYESIEADRRKGLHLTVAETLVQHDPSSVESIGHHFSEAGAPIRATKFLRVAGLRAIDLNAYATARRHFEAAAAAARHIEMSTTGHYRLLGHLEDVLNVLGDRQQQHQVVSEMAALVTDLQELAGDVERRRAWLEAQQGDLNAAEVSASKSVELEKKYGDSDSVAGSLVALGTIVRWSGRPLDAIPVLEEAVAVDGSDMHRALALTELASTLVEVARTELALKKLAEAEALYRQTDDLRGQAEVAGIQGRIHHLEGKREASYASYETAIDICRRIGYRYGEGVNLTNLAIVHQQLGGIAEALKSYDQAARIFNDLRNTRGEAMVLANSASGRHHLLGEDERARRDATKAERLFKEIGDEAREAQCQETLAGIAARAGNHHEARRLLESGLEALRASGNLYIEAQHLRSLALLLLESGDIESAQDAIGEALDVCREAGFDDLIVELLSIEGLLQLRLGDPDKAVTLTRRAVDQLTPGVESHHLVHHRLALVAEAVGARDEARTSRLRADALLRNVLSGLRPAEFDRAVHHVPEHHEIVTAAGQLTPRTVEVQLPLAEVPTGRPLQADDLCVVTWTVEHPDDTHIESPVGRRRARIARLLTEADSAGASPTTEHLADVLGVSTSTIRRDLTALRGQGHAASTRGQRRQVS
ncbi:MAG: tetratricopeptide repeat protein [Acidimicrobiia bacterium]|jgi:DNA-binding SARP family transcriptional activator/predicted ATPase